MTNVAILKFDTMEIFFIIWIYIDNNYIYITTSVFQFVYFILPLE